MSVGNSETACMYAFLYPNILLKVVNSFDTRELEITNLTLKEACLIIFLVLAEISAKSPVSKFTKLAQLRFLPQDGSDSGVS